MSRRGRDRRLERRAARRRGRRRSARLSRRRSTRSARRSSSSTSATALSMRASGRRQAACPGASAARATPRPQASPIWRQQRVGGHARCRSAFSADSSRKTHGHHDATKTRRSTKAFYVQRRHAFVARGPTDAKIVRPRLMSDAVARLSGCRPAYSAVIVAPSGQALARAHHGEGQDMAPQANSASAWGHSVSRPTPLRKMPRRMITK